eukprot:UN19314
MIFKMPSISVFCDTIKISKSPLKFNQGSFDFLHLKISFRYLIKLYILYCLDESNWETGRYSNLLVNKYKNIVNLTGRCHFKKSLQLV